MSVQTRIIRYDFRGHQGFPVSGTGRGTPFVIALTGAPNFTGLEGGGFRMSFNAENDIQNACLYMGDVLPFDIDDLIRAWVIARTAATLDSTTSIALGVASERNDTIDTIAEQALFRCIGNNNVVVETDDGTNNNDDVSTGLTLTDTWKRLEINFADRVTTIQPPSASTGGKSNVSFYMGNAHGSLRRVASGTRFDMDNYAGGFQLYAQLQKTADTNTNNLDILEMGVELKLPDFA